MLEVSRSDIETDSITEFPADTRFIKLPIERYLKLLGAYEDLNRPQIALINAINNPKYRFITAAYSRRVGKTYISNIIAQLVLLIPEVHIVIVSPNYSLSTISFELQRKFIARFDLEITRNNLKDRVIELANGSTIRMTSVSNIDNAVGRSYSLILFDEAALAAKGEDAFNIQLRPTLDLPNSKAIFISTPRGMNNWFSTFYFRGFDPKFPAWASLTADYHENHRVSQEDIEEARSTLTEANFKQEYLASFNSFAGQIYHIDKTVNVVSYEPRDRVEFIGGCDPGFTDPTAFSVIAYYTEPVLDKEGEHLLDSLGEPRYTDIFHVVEDYLEAGRVTSEHAVAFQKMIDHWGIDLIFCDSAMAQFINDMTYEFDICMSRAKKSVLPGIAHLQNLLEKGQLRIDPKCKHVIAAMDQYAWNATSASGKESPAHSYSDVLDCLRYGIYSFTV